jgi:hypothetical protein
MKTQLNLTPIELLHASKGLILLGKRIEELKTRGYTERDIENIIADHKPETIRLAYKFLLELRSVKGKA